MITEKTSSTKTVSNKGDEDFDMGSVYTED